MGRRIFTIALWSLVAILIVRTCMPAPDEAPVAIGAITLEDFSQPQSSDYPLVLENSLIRSEWTALGASCGKVVLKEYLGHLVQGEPQPSDWIVAFDSARVPSKSPQREGEQGVIYHRKRDGFRLTETSDILLPADPVTGVKPNLDGVEWTVESEPAQGELRFHWTSAAGIQVIKTVRLPEGAYHFEAEVTLIAPAAGGPLLGQDVGFRLATGGGIEVTPDPYYRNPWAAAGLTEHGQLDDVEFHFPNGGLPPSRAVAHRWSGSIPMVAEGSKYFISAIHALDRDFNGAVAEVFFDDLAFIRRNPQALTGAFVDPKRAEFWSRTSVGGSFTLAMPAASSS